MNSRIGLIAFMAILLYACTPPYNEVNYSYSNNENFCITVYNGEVEFVKDNIEFVKIMGNYNSPDRVARITEDTFVLSYPFPFLLVQGTDSPPDDLIKIEVHYVNLRRIIAPTGVPLSLGYTAGRTLYTREAIDEDTIDLTLCVWQDSVIEVNTQVLKLTAGGLERSSLKGYAHILDMEAMQPQGYPSFNSVFRYDELITDSAHIHMTGSFQLADPDFQTKIYVQANNFLEIDAGGVAGDGFSCPNCLCQIYYKGYPTILNHDSLNPKVVLIDNN